MASIKCENEIGCAYPECECGFWPAILKAEPLPKRDVIGPNAELNRMHSESNLQPPVEHCPHCKGLGFVVLKDPES